MQLAFEWPLNNDGWKEPLLRELLQDLPFTCEFDGCAYGVQTTSGEAVRKRWRVQTTFQALQNYLGDQCQGQVHAPVRGKEATRAGFYPCMLAKAVAKSLMQDLVAPVGESFDSEKATEDVSMPCEQTDSEPEAIVNPKIQKPLVGPTKQDWNAHETTHIPFSVVVSVVRDDSRQGASTCDGVTAAFGTDTFDRD